MRQTLLLLTILLFSGNFLFGQTDKDLGLHSEGGAWSFFPATEYDQLLPNVLLIGNSVMNGFHQFIIDSLSGQANVDYWLTPKHLKSEFLLEDLAKIGSFRNYEVIQFNIGLHGWPEGRIPNNEYPLLLEKYVQTLKESCNNSHLIWSSITPVTETDKTQLNAEINPTIVKRNKIANGLMEKYGIPVNDLYGLAVKNIHLSKGDRFHWKAEAYKRMAEQSLSYIHRGLKRNTGSSSVAEYNIIWDSPSKNSLGSMPAGNGDIGINLWVEENGDLLFYLSKTDAWSGNGRLLKIGKVRISLSPNPFKKGLPFHQELVLSDGMINIVAGDNENSCTVNIWVDANNPVVEVDVSSMIPLNAVVSTEPWRTSRREIVNTNEIHSAYGLNGVGGPAVFVEKDSILQGNPEGILWVHRNQKSMWQDNLKLQGLESFIPANKDPLLHRSFGCLLKSDKLEKKSSKTLTTAVPKKNFTVSAILYTAQTETLNQWTNQITKIASNLSKQSRSVRLGEHKAWWKSFWNRSYINISTIMVEEKDKVFAVSKGYALQRYMIACSGRGNSPIKFNGSIFTVDTEFLPGQYAGLDADYRRWGGPYWFQNTRLPYWTMLESGDLDLMQPLFKMYLQALPNRKLATELYYGHKGAFFPETMNFWGTFADANYGRDRRELPLGMTENQYIRYYWQDGLELSLMMLDYYSFTKSKDFARDTLVPFVTEILTFFDSHWQRGLNGKIRFSPAMSLETFHTAVDPLPEIVGIRAVSERMLALPLSFSTDSQRLNWRQLISDLPEIPLRESDGITLLAPAAEYSDKKNSENPELYSVFPYRTFGVGKANIELAQNTFAVRTHKENGGWQQNSIQAAYLGLADEAKRMIIESFSNWDKNFRFIAFWGPNYDWTPDQTHGSVAMTALQRMLVQYEDVSIQMLPAWPNNWDVEFKLHIPDNKIIEGEFKNGKIININQYANN